MPRLAIIVPYLNSDSPEALEETLASLLENRSESTDVCVVNAGGYSDRYDIEAEGVRFLQASPGDSILSCVNQGIQASRSDFVHPILCGATVGSDWTQKALERLNNREISAVIPLVVETDSTPDDRLKESGENEKNAERTDAIGSGDARTVRPKSNPRRIVRAGLVYRRDGSVFPLKRDTELKTWDRIAPHIGGAFFRRSTLEELGGLNSEFSLQAAYIDLTLSMDALEERTVWEVGSIVRYPLGTFKTQENFWDELTEQTRLFSRWTDLGDSFGTMIRRQWRVIRLAAARLFSGEFFSVLSAIKKGKKSNATAEKRKLIARIQKERARVAQKAETSGDGGAKIRSGESSAF